MGKKEPFRAVHKWLEPARACHKWLKKEDQMLIHGFQAGRMPRKLARNHLRSEGAIWLRLEHLGALAFYLGTDVHLLTFQQRYAFLKWIQHKSELEYPGPGPLSNWLEQNIQDPVAIEHYVQYMLGIEWEVENPRALVSGQDIDWIYDPIDWVNGGHSISFSGKFIAKEQKLISTNDIQLLLDEWVHPQTGPQSLALARAQGYRDSFTMNTLSIEEFELERTQQCEESRARDIVEAAVQNNQDWVDYNSPIEDNSSESGFTPDDKWDERYDDLDGSDWESMLRGPD